MIIDQKKINIISVANDNKVIQSIGEQFNEGTLVKDAIHVFALSNDDKFLCTAHPNSVIKLWQTNDGAWVKNWDSKHDGSISQLDFTANEPLIASGGKTDGFVQI